jgi:hypothetical protein
MEDLRVLKLAHYLIREGYLATETDALRAAVQLIRVWDERNTDRVPSDTALRHPEGVDHR